MASEQIPVAHDCIVCKGSVRSYTYCDGATIYACTHCGLLYSQHRERDDADTALRKAVARMADYTPVVQRCATFDLGGAAFAEDFDRMLVALKAAAREAKERE